MNISIIGAGYIGLITGAGFAEKGHKIICVDVVKEKVDIINSGKSPIYEKGLDKIIKKNIGKNLTATTNIRDAVLNSDVIFICVGTPPNNDGKSDLRFVKEATENIGKILAEKNSYNVVVVKSTVLPGTTEGIIIPLLEKNSKKKFGKDFGVVMNPEFLREGVALEDFLKPDRIVIGSIDKRSGDLIEKLYSGFSKILRTNLKTAEMIKYVSNAFLATKVSFINEIGNICKKLGINVYDVANGIALDHRIGPYFLNSGLGFGGSCFPKDVKALVYEAKKLGYEPELLNSVLNVNSRQPKILLRIAKKKIGNFRNKKIAILGLAFKRGTDDIRDTQSFPVIEWLLKEGAVITAYDPKAIENTKKVFGDRIKYANSADSTLENSELALILTEWDEFSNLDFSRMKEKIVIDARNIVKNRDNIDYEGLCW